MSDCDLAQPAIVFWMHNPGAITRFERLGDAIQAIMQAASAKTGAIAWIQTKDRHLSMDEIRSIAKRFSLTWRLSQIIDHVGEITTNLKSMDRPKRRRNRWSSVSPMPQG
jgi:hypothetical protein